MLLLFLWNCKLNRLFCSDKCIYHVAVAQVVALMPESRLHIPAALVHYTQTSTPSWILSVPVCDSWLRKECMKRKVHNVKHFKHLCCWWTSVWSLWRYKTEVEVSCSLSSKRFSFSIIYDIIIIKCYLPHATFVTFAPQSSVTSRGRCSFCNELWPSCPYWPEPNVNTAPSWEPDNSPY